MRISDWSSDVCSSDLRVRVGAIRPVKSIPATRVLPALTSSVPPAGSLAALQSPSGDRGASVPPGAVVLQVACVFRPEIGNWTTLYHPTNGEAFRLILTSPAWKSERIPHSISVTFYGANHWQIGRAH